MAHINPHEHAARYAKASKIVVELTKASCAAGRPISELSDQSIEIAARLAKVPEPSDETKRVVRILLGLDEVRS